MLRRNGYAVTREVLRFRHLRDSNRARYRRATVGTTLALRLTMNDATNSKATKYTLSAVMSADWHRGNQGAINNIVSHLQMMARKGPIEVYDASGRRLCRMG